CLSTKTNTSEYHSKPEQIDQIKNSASNFMSPHDQVAHFSGHVYIIEDNVIYVPGGYLLDRERYNVMMSGPLYVLDHTSSKTTPKAWEAFTMNRAVKFPKVHAATFMPELAPGAIIDKDGELVVN